MDERNLPLEVILAEMHKKFGENQKDGVEHLQGKSRTGDALATAFFHIGEFLLENETSLEHHRLLAGYLREIFADSTCATYLAFSGLDTAARILIRRILELGYVFLAYDDSPAKFWDWNSNDKDISFSELETLISGPGFIKFLKSQTNIAEAEYQRTVVSLRKSYGDLSNVVHPKPYNFETRINTAFQFSKLDLDTILDSLYNVQRGLLKLIFSRFPNARAKINDIMPTIVQDALQ